MLSEVIRQKGKGNKPEVRNIKRKRIFFFLLTPDSSTVTYRYDMESLTLSGLNTLRFCGQNSFRQNPKSNSRYDCQGLSTLSRAKKYFPNSNNTIIRWCQEIIAYFDNRTTSGTVEGINNKLKLIKRSGYGFKNFESFRIRCLLNWHFV